MRQRRGDLGRVPDVVVRPGDEAAVTEILRAALEADAVVIPFGGGTSISGSLEAPREETRTVISVDLERMDAVLAIDAIVAARARAGRRLRPAPGGAAQRPGLHVRPLPRLVHVLDARRLDRHALVGHAVRPLRRHRRLDARAAGRHPGRAARHAPGAGDLDRAERARDGARLRGPARDHLRGDDPGPAPAAGAHDPRLPVPELGRVGGGDARHRGQRGGAVGHARGRRQRDGVLVRDQEGLASLLDTLQSTALKTFLKRAQGLRARGDVPRLHRLRGPRVPRQGAAQGGRPDRLQARRPLHRLEPGRALRPEEVRHALHPRLPARPRRARRRVGDRRAVERARPAARRGASAAAAARSPTSASRAT